jgi:hypothetical protein
LDDLGPGNLNKVGRRVREGRKRVQQGHDTPKRIREMFPFEFDPDG